jgi:hypothetical protein
MGYSTYTTPAYKSDSAMFVEHLRKLGINCLYHFTSRKNIESIRAHGGLYSWYYLDNHGIAIPCPGGTELSKQLDRYNGLQDYVRLSLCSDHPMAYRLMQQGDDPVVLKISLDVVQFEDTLFSDMNATDRNHHHGGTFNDLLKINVSATQQHYLRRDDPQFKAHQAEVMPKTFVSSKYILNLDQF